MFKFVLYVSLFIKCFSYLGWSNRICRQHRQYRQPRQFYLRDKFSPVLEESTIEIKHENEKFRKLKNRVFVQIGSNPKHMDDKDYHWFDGDGMVHGVFFNESSITYQNRWVRTKRFEVENKWNKKMYLYFGELKGMNGLMQILKFSLMEMFGILPQARGTANTAFLKWENRIFALHEGDMPYELEMNHQTFNISTKQRLEYPSVHSTTAHPIKDKHRQLLYLYGYNNYDFAEGKFIFNVFDKEMNHVFQKNISLINNGMTHDVGFVNKYMIIPDMPLKYDISRIFNEELPLYFDRDGGITRFGIFDVESREEPKWYVFDKNFFIFHFSRVYKTHHGFSVFACAMDNLFMEDFVDLGNWNNKSRVIRGELRLKKLNIHTKTNKTEIIENEYINNLPVDFPYNLDFPVKSLKQKSKVYCTIFDSSTGYIRGYLKVDTRNYRYAIPKIFLFDKECYGNSEPQVVIIDNVEYLISFVTREGKSFISLINVDTGKEEFENIPLRIPPGFHSNTYKID